MFNLIVGIIARIVSNSYLNVFQKILTGKGEKSSVVNFYTYLGLFLIGIIFCPHPAYTQESLPFILIMGVLGALGNYFIIKALSCGELSILAPINSYKPMVALLVGVFMLGEIPGVNEIIGMILIILGTFILIEHALTPSKAYFYRLLALIFSGTEAVFIKKVILLTNISSAFLYWAAAGLIFALIISLKHRLRISKSSIKPQIVLILLVGIMQYSTNYVFSKINTAYALSLFQLSTILSIFLGANIFKEKGLLRKLAASLIMILGAVTIILSGYHPI